MQITLHGHSDDYIKIDGGHRNEVDAYNKRYLLFADGSVVSGEFTDAGIWRFKVEQQGLATATLESFEGEADDDADDSATDRLTLECPGDLSLLWHGEESPPSAPLDALVRAAKVRSAILLKTRAEDDDGYMLAVIVEALQQSA